MVAQGFYQPICFNPAFVYLVAGFLIGLSLRYYFEHYVKHKQPAVPVPRKKGKRRR